MKPRRYFGTPPPLIPTVRGTSRVLLLTGILASCAAPAGAAPIELGVQDDPLLVRSPSAFGGFGGDRLLEPAQVDAALDALRVDTVRINVQWSQVAGERPRRSSAARALRGGRRPGALARPARAADALGARAGVGDG